MSRGKSYERGSHDVNGAGSYSYSRSMSNDNWRDAKSSSHVDDEYRGGGAVSRSWGNDYHWGQCSSVTRTGGGGAVSHSWGNDY